MTGDPPYLFEISQGDLIMKAYAKIDEILTAGYLSIQIALQLNCHFGATYMGGMTGEPLQNTYCCLRCLDVS